MHSSIIPNTPENLELRMKLATEKTNATGMDTATQLKEKVLQLEQQLLELHPQMPILLRTIHTQLRADPALVTTLSEDDIGILVSGLAKQQQIEIATSIVKSTPKKSMKSLTVNDL